MDAKKLLIGAALAGLMVGVSACSSGSSTTGSVVGECHGINACKGTGDCGGKGHGCAGMNTCKGKGWKKMTQADCESKSGKFVSKS